MREGIACEPASLVKERPWSFVMRLPGAYLKAAARPGRHEAGLVGELARRFPGLVAGPLAIEREAGWMVLPDLGPSLREVLAGAPAERWLAELLPRYAELQMASGRELDRWRELGVPDRSPHRLPSLLESVVERAARAAGGPFEIGERVLSFSDELVVRCAELGAMPGGTALDHGDLHAGNLAPRADGGSWIFDWGDSCLCHPFVSLLVTLLGAGVELAREESVAPLRDRYLEPWTEVASRSELRRMFRVAMWVAHATRALDWDHMLADAGAEAREPFVDAVPEWLGRFVASRDLAG